MREKKVGMAGLTTLFTVSLAIAAGSMGYAGEKSGNKLNTAEVVVLQSEDFLPAHAQPVKSIELGDNQADYSYHELIEAAKKLAFQSDANVIKIKERIKRSRKHPTDKIVATLYKVDNARVYEKELSWSKDRKLTWDDFRGPIPADADDITAAATFCGIGFETNTISSSNKNLRIKVYNTFYTNHSWGRAEEMNDDVLAHEQGHFDLCELYTRKLRQRMQSVKVDVQSLKPLLRDIYTQVQEEYKNRQAVYEDDTAHGVNLMQQKKWQKILERELADTETWGSTESLALAN